MNGSILCPFNKIYDLIIIQALHYDYIHFYVKIFIDQQLNIVGYGFKLVSPGDELKFISL